ncbi:Zinc transporter ZupT [Corynebacterium occultum]|uniref:Zinc transporter ZupT n=1 Tax=Corynebacterium occultum TaxID=2675219 RepID=A0A6B8W7V4_9CORY|nr:zinc transporter ZupT [Corynebacterium occultum]QGU06966.1 Zinc transporter ZupT [Corynebacterium occultum]
MSAILIAFGMTVFAGLATGIGGLIAILKKNPDDRFMASALGFSAGVMLYVSMVEILPKAIDHLSTDHGVKNGNWWAILSFFAGIVLIAAIDRLVPTAINPHESMTQDTPELQARRQKLMKMGTLTALAIAIHNFPEGFATFLTALDDPTLAIPIVAAIAIHNIPEGIAVAVPIREATGSRLKAFNWSTLSGMAEPLGAVIGYLILLPFLGDTTLGVAFGMVAGIMVFISMDELLPTAVATGRHHHAIYGLILGMAVMAVSLVLFL